MQLKIALTLFNLNSYEAAFMYEFGRRTFFFFYQKNIIFQRTQFFKFLRVFMYK